MQTALKNTTRNNLGRLGLLALLAVALGSAGCKSSPDRTSGQVMSDRQVAREVKKQLKDDVVFKYQDVNTDVYNGTVQLTGFVETPEQRFRAAELAAQAKGAKQIINGIMLKPIPTGHAIIRDPLGHDTGHLLVDTNAPVPQMRNLAPSDVPKTDATPGNEGSAPKQ